MQGHAEVSTLAYLPKPAHVPTREEWGRLTGGLNREIKLKSEASLREDLLKDPAKAKLPKKEFAALLQTALNAEVEKMGGERYEEALANHVAKAQREAARAPEPAGTVAAVESWPLTTPEVAVWRMKKDVARAEGNSSEIERTEQQWPLYGSNQGYHYDGSGRFFIRFGDEFATAMLELMGRE